MSGILVAAYSRTGVTQSVATAVASALEADLEPIRDFRSRFGFIQYLLSGREALTKKEPRILTSRIDPGEYDLVILGTPVWAGHIASPMRSYIKKNRSRFKRWAVFCTEGGNGHDKVFREMAELLGSKPLATFYATESQVKNNVFQSQLSKFVDEVDRYLTQHGISCCHSDSGLRQQ